MPLQCSNTAKLDLEHGWTGVVVDWCGDTVVEPGQKRPRAVEVNRALLTSPTFLATQTFLDTSDRAVASCLTGTKGMVV
jgi:hypothetical protein